MRLVYLYDVELPSPMASAVNVTKSCATLAAEGHDVTLVHFRGRGDIASYYGLTHGFDRLALPYPKKFHGSHRLLVWTGALLGRLKRAIVYARKAPLLVPAVRLGCPVALELHAPMGPDGHNWDRAFAELLKSGRLRAIICISQALADKIATDWPEAKPLIAVAHDAAEPGPLPARRVPHKRERPLLAYAGHLYPGKGMDLIAELARRRPDWDILVVGGRDEDVERWRQATKGSSNLDFAGMVPHAKVSERLADADVLLAPYGSSVIVSDGRIEVAKWMSPLKLFEYMALAKPIVASDLPVLREVLEDGRNARLARRDDAADWERVIESILAEPAEAAAMGRRARQELEKTYSWRGRAQAIAAVLAG